MPTVSAHVAATLARHIDHVFGVMGNGNAHFLDALERSTDVGYTAVRHEAGGVVAADAYHRAGGGLAAATATYGAGFTNTLTALAEAVQAHVPLVLVVGDEPTSGPRPWDVDQIALASAVGARTYTVGRADAAATTVIAIEHALTYRVPTVLAIPYDVAALEAGPVPEAPEPRVPGPVAPRGPFATQAVRDVAAALAGAKRPFLLAGHGAWIAGAGEALGDLADATGALTASTALGRGIFPARQFDLGVTGGFGAEARDGARRRSRRRRRVRRVPQPVHDALRRALRARHARLPGRSRPRRHPSPRRGLRPGRRRGRRPRDRRRAAAIGAAPSGWRESADVGVAPRLRAGRRPRRRRAARPALGRRTHRRAASRRPRRRLRRRPLHRLGEHVLAGGIARSHADGGHGVPVDRARVPERSRRGLAKPEATIVLTTGDGGGLMALADLESAVRVARGRGLAVVWNDAAYGAEVNLYGLKGLAEAPMLIPEVDFAGVAKGFGAEGVVVRTLGDLDRLAEWVATAGIGSPLPPARSAASRER